MNEITILSCLIAFLITVGVVIIATSHNRDLLVFGILTNIFGCLMGLSFGLLLAFVGDRQHSFWVAGIGSIIFCATMIFFVAKGFKKLQI